MNIKNLIISWIPLAITITLLCGLIGVAVQQSYRTSANDPQIQYSKEVAANFKDAKTAESLVPQEKTNIDTSLATFGIVYNKDGGLLASSAVLDNKTPSLPSGALDIAKKKGENRITWQPKNGVRIAAVITKGDAGYVLIGRSLKEIEKREIALGIIILIGWAFTLLVTFLSMWAPGYLATKKSSKKTKK